MLTKQEIRQLKLKEIQEELIKASNELLRTRMEIMNGYSKESHKLNSLKKYVALLNTVLTEQAGMDVPVKSQAKTL